MQADPFHQPMYLEYILDALARHAPGKCVMDAGCGDGNFSESLRQAGYDMHGIDLSDGGISKAKALYPEIRFARYSVYDDLRQAFGGESHFDGIVSIEVIEHLYAPRSFLTRCHEALRPNGVLILTTPYWGYLKNVALAVTNRIDRSLTVLWDGGHIKHFSRKTLSFMLEEQGFQVIGFKGCGRKIPYLWKGMALVALKEG